jgi:hypothetical protein
MAVPGDLEALATAAAAEPSKDYAGPHHYLIRPDAYVALSTGPDGGEPIAAFLRGIRDG